MVNPSKNPKNARNVSLWPTSNIPQTGKKNVREQTHSHPYTEGMQYTHFCSKKRPSFFGERPHFPQILLPPQHSKGPRCHPGGPENTDLEKMGWIPCHLGRHKLAFGRSQKSSRNWSPQATWNIGWKPHLGVSENSVPLNPMVNDHYPY
jgi:hypothetical protein